METTRGTKKQKVGLVVSDSMDKTITVKVERKFAHPIYKKIIKVHKKYYAHDPDRLAKEGDTVKIMETRPVSKLKRWRLIEVVKSAHIKSEVQSEEREA
ncbi:30S ribosomal protein S17 [Chlamydiota bacterium]